MTPLEKMALIKRHSFTEWTSLVGCKAKPRQLSRWQYIVTRVSDTLSCRRPIKLVVPQVSLRWWDNGPTLKQYPIGHLDRYCVNSRCGYKTLSLTGLLDNYDLFHLDGKPVQQTVLDWEPTDHTRDTRVSGVTYTYLLKDSAFVVQVADLIRSTGGMGVAMATRPRDDGGDGLLIDFQVSKRSRKRFLASMSHRKGLVEPWPTPTDII